MSLQEYPAYALPLPSEAYAVQEENTVIRTMFESGRARQRRRFSHNLKLMQVNWLFTYEQFLVWRVFLIEGISNGADYFTMEFLIDDVLDEKTVRIVEGSYNAQKSDNWWRVNAVVEIENMELSEYPGLFSIYEVLKDDFDGEEAIERIDLLHTLVHETLPDVAVLP